MRLRYGATDGNPECRWNAYCGIKVTITGELRKIITKFKTIYTYDEAFSDFTNWNIRFAYTAATTFTHRSPSRPR